MKSFVKEQSFRYMSTICQIAGLACSSGFASKVHQAIMSGNAAGLNIELLGFKYSCITLIIGIMLLALGWYIMYLVDKDKAELGG